VRHELHDGDIISFVPLPGYAYVFHYTAPAPAIPKSQPVAPPTIAETETSQRLTQPDLEPPLALAALNVSEGHSETFESAFGDKDSDNESLLSVDENKEAIHVTKENKKSDSNMQVVGVSKPTDNWALTGHKRSSSSPTPSPSKPGCSKDVAKEKSFSPLSRFIEL